MSPSDDRSPEPWTDPQTHLDTDPVNAEPTAEPTPEPTPEPVPDEAPEDDAS